MQKPVDADRQQFQMGKPIDFGKYRVDRLFSRVRRTGVPLRLSRRLPSRRRRQCQRRVAVHERDGSYSHFYRQQQTKQK